MKSKKQTTNTGKPEQLASAPALPDKPATTIELHPTDNRGVFTAKISGKRTVVCFTARNRSSADKRFVSVTIAPGRLKAASTAANKDSLPVNGTSEVGLALLFILVDDGEVTLLDDGPIHYC